MVVCGGLGLILSPMALIVDTLLETHCCPHGKTAWSAVLWRLHESGITSSGIFEIPFERSAAKTQTTRFFMLHLIAQSVVITDSIPPNTEPHPHLCTGWLSFTMNLSTTFQGESAKGNFSVCHSLSEALGSILLLNSGFIRITWCKPHLS